jgi:hypothetical protein
MNIIQFCDELRSVRERERETDEGIDHLVGGSITRWMD